MLLSFTSLACVGVKPLLFKLEIVWFWPSNVPAKNVVSPYATVLVAATSLNPSPIGFQPSFRVMSFVNLTVLPAKLFPEFTASLNASNCSSEEIS